MIEEFTIPKPINPHGHLRQGRLLVYLAQVAVLFFSAYLAMPNTVPGLYTGTAAIGYRARINAACKKKNKKMAVIPTIKITEKTTIAMLRAAFKRGIRFAKVYPLGRTTHADDGVANYYKLWHLFAEGEKLGMTFLFHPTHPDKMFGNCDAEYLFLPIFLLIKQNFPKLRMTWEHLSERRCIEPLKALAKRYGGIFVTITAHHLYGNEDVHHGDVHATCQPPIRTEDNRLSLLRFVLENHRWVMAGLDDAPHSIKKKHVFSGCGACGAYTTPHGTLIYVTVFAEAGRLENMSDLKIFRNFVSANAAKYLGIKESKETMTIVRKPTEIPLKYKFGKTTIVPYRAGQSLPFSYKRPIKLAA